MKISYYTNMFINKYLKSKDLRKAGIKCGDGCEVHETCLVLNSKKFILGNNVRIDARCNFINKNKIIINNFATISPNCIFNTSTKIIKIGKYAHLSDNVRIYCASEIQSAVKIAGKFGENKKKNIRLANIQIGDYCIIASNTLIIPFAHLSKGSSVGANSVVNKKLNSWTVYYNNPLKELKKRKFT